VTHASTEGACEHGRHVRIQLRLLGSGRASTAATFAFSRA
jgi:hypothetical protein